MAMGLFGLQVVMSNGGLWKVSGNQATVRPADPVIQAANNNSVTLAGGPNYSMIETPSHDYILTLSGNGLGFLYNSLADAYTAAGLLFPNPIQGYYGVLGAATGRSLPPGGRADHELVDDHHRRLLESGRDPDELPDAARPVAHPDDRQYGQSQRGGGRAHG